MSVRHCVSLLGLASLLLFQFAAAESDPASTCAENCRFVVVPSLGPAGPAGPPGLNGTKGDKGDRGDAATLDTSTVYANVQLRSVDITLGKTTGLQIWSGAMYENAFENGWLYNAKFYGTTEIGLVGNDQEYANPVTTIHSPKIYNGVLSGATTLENGAALNSPVIASPTITGATSIGAGAIMLRPNITAPIIDGATSIGEGATIDRPNITAPIIDGATSIGEGATIDRPSITAPTISDAELTGITSAKRLVVGPNAPTVCQGSTNETRLTFHIGNFGWGHIGSMIKWDDGSTSVIIDATSSEQGTGTTGRINDEAVRAFMGCTFYSSRNNFISTTAVAQDGAIPIGTAVTSLGMPVIHQDWPGFFPGARVLTLSLEPMKTRNKAVWFFPAPPTAGDGSQYNDTFVGLDMVQTITNKTLKTVPSMEFTSAANTADALNNRDYTDAAANPAVPAKAPVASVGSTLLDFYETVRFQLPVTGHLKALNATGSPVPIWSTVTCTRIGRAVIMNAEELLVEKVNLIRPAESIWFGLNNVNHRLPIMCRPKGNRHFYTTVQDGTVGGVHKPGRLVVFSDGQMRVDVQKSDLTFGPFGEIASNIQVYSGFQSLSASWNI